MEWLNLEGMYILAIKNILKTILPTPSPPQPKPESSSSELLKNTFHPLIQVSQLCPKKERRRENFFLCVISILG
jgi:hypothetical protein